MEKIFILGNSNTAKESGFNFIEIPNLTNDYEIHNWLISIFNKNEIDKLIIEIPNDSILSLKIGLHIRLSIEYLKEKALLPILFASISSLKSIMIDTKIWSQILATKGIGFSDFDKMGIEISANNGILIDEYKMGFLNIIKILPDEVTGRHSLANVWGAHSMDKAANANALFGNNNFEKDKTKLYFKYISALNYDRSKHNPPLLKIIDKIPVGNPNKINATNKKVLLIDDEADKGWEIVLRKVFKTSATEDFVVIKEKVNDYNNLSVESKNLIENTPFDLYLIDLRLNGIEEDKTLKPEDFSGMKVLQKIKSLNQGYQAIIFTASNKVWNLKALLDAGADGYYMKESPEFGFSNEFSEQNYLRFKEDVKNCFERNFLKTLYISYQEIIKRIDCFTYPFNFKSELKTQLQLFWDMILVTKTKTQFAYSYITLCMVIELVNKHLIQYNSQDKTWEICNKDLLLDWEWNEEKYINTNTKITNDRPPEWQKFAGLYFQELNQTDGKFVQEVYRLIRKRNGFVHTDKRILDEKNNGQYLNHDIYIKDGVVKLFDAIKKIIELL